VFFLVFLIPFDVFALHAKARGGIELPSIEEREDFPIFSIYKNVVSRIGEVYSDSLNVIIAVWGDGYCISSDDINGGPPYKCGFLAEPTLHDIEKKLHAFKPPQITDLPILDAFSETWIAVRDEYTSKCLTLRLSLEEYSLNEPLYRDRKNNILFFDAWKDLRQFGKMINRSQISLQENVTFSLKRCPPHETYTSVVFRYIGSDRKQPVHPVILNSCEEGYHTVLQDIPAYLIVSCNRETVKPDSLSALYTILSKNASLGGSASGTTEITFYWSNGKKNYTLDLDQILEMKKYWAEFSPLPSSVARYFEEILKPDGQ